MGQNPVPPVNIPILTKISSKMDGESTYPPKWEFTGFDHHRHFPPWDVEGAPVSDPRASDRHEGRLQGLGAERQDQSHRSCRATRLFGSAFFFLFFFLPRDVGGSPPCSGAEAKKKASWSCVELSETEFLAS